MTFKICHKLIKIERNCYKKLFKFYNSFSHYIENSIKLIINTYDQNIKIILT